jgi:hypothetical protein
MVSSDRHWLQACARWLSAIVAGWIVALGPAWAAHPPIRSTHYDGTAQAYVEFEAEDRFDSQVSLTIEAWVYRENDARIETMLAHGVVNSFWFGFNREHPSFTRDGRNFADSPLRVEAGHWTHVAVTYDGGRARFYHDGFFAGSIALDHHGSGQQEVLRLGGHVLGVNLLGSMDEVRLWSVARTRQEIEADMFVEPRGVAGLVAVFSDGSVSETIAGVRGSAGSGVMHQVWGLLPANLVIPNASARVNVDGRPQLDSEYDCAEQVVIRYRGGPAPDATAYLVYSDTDLHIAVTGLRDVPPGRERARSWVGVSFDPDYSGDELARFTDFQIRGHLSGDVPQFWVGDGQGGLFHMNFRPDQTWSVAFDQCPDEFAPPCMEFRIAKSWLGDWSGTNGFMIGHYAVQNDGDHYRNPGDAVETSPATWPSLVYGETTCQWPVARLSGHVYDGDAVRPVANHGVQLVDDANGTLLARALTDARGRYDFDLRVPINHALRVLVDECAQCRYLDPEVDASNIQPTRQSAREVTFPGRAGGTNRYAEVDFLLRTPIGGISLTGFTPERAAPELVLREAPRKTLPGQVVRILGTNFHTEIQVFLYDCPDLPPSNRSDCRFGETIIEVPGTNITVAADGRWVEVLVPHVPRESLDRAWAWAVKDNWVRPGQLVWQAVGGLFGGPAFRLSEHEYPVLHGFEFDNEDDSVGLRDFDGVFGRNAYVCLGVEDLFGCACLVRDPLYALYYLVYDGWISSSGGSCVGMSAASLLFAHGVLAPAMFVDGVHYAAGFEGEPPADNDGDLGPPKPVRYVDLNCEPTRPRNVWAHIRVNHGVQASAEFIDALLEQTAGGLFSLGGDPADVLNRVSANPWQTVVTILRGVDGGHAVTPYAVVAGVNRDGIVDADHSLIRVYDNNFPQRTDRFIEITHAGRDDRYHFPRGDDVTDDGDRWFGDAIYAIPLSIWQGERTAPGLLTALEAMVAIVFGDADGHYSDAQGHQWGWRPDGTFVDDLPGARAIVPTGGGLTFSRNLMLTVPVTNEPPKVSVNVRGSRYVFHGAQGGRLMQLERRDAAAGDRDVIQVGYEGARLASFSFRPQRVTSDFEARMGLALARRERAVFQWSGMELLAGQTVEFRALAVGRGVEWRNQSQAPLRPVIRLSWVDGPSSIYGTNRFQSIAVPPGAAQRLILVDWPHAHRLRSEVDLNADGTPELVDDLPGTAVRETDASYPYGVTSPRFTTLAGMSRSGNFAVSGMLEPNFPDTSRGLNWKLRGSFTTLYSPEVSFALPVLQATCDAQSRTVVLRWEGPSGFVLEESEDLGSPVWRLNPILPSAMGSESVVSLEVNARARFFRLRRN